MTLGVGDLRVVPAATARTLVWWRSRCSLRTIASVNVVRLCFDHSVVSIGAVSAANAEGDEAVDSDDGDDDDAEELDT